MSELPPQYDPKSVEPKWYDLWEEQGYFKPRGDGPAYCVMIPPPNVTGSLHVGHALNNTLQDILVRWKRMDGYRVLWQPGTDHAGIATQLVVSKQLEKQGIKRVDLGREEFLKRVWAWKEEAGGTIVRQLRRLGSSPDWSRERFTMDDGLSRAVRTAFVQLFEKKKCERDFALTNWCPGECKTVLSDLEVEHEDLPARPFNPAKPDFQKDGRLYHLKYPLTKPVGGVDHVTVATTRPETMLGDTAVAVHPDDERYVALVKAKATIALPLTDRKIPLIADTMVDKTFGSGAVKITPAHDPNDFETGKRHDLPQISIFDLDAKINENGFAYRGMDRYEARKKIVADLLAAGLLEKVEGHAQSIGHCQRCHTVVEPMLGVQWFVRTRSLADAAAKAVRDGRTKIVPEQQQEQYFRWMANIRDWCISRQLWWGHQIPAWYCPKCDPNWRFDLEAKPIVAMEKPAACPRCKGKELVQDPDVLDTWFSSGTWPFSTLGWPDRTPELKTFYPTSTLITAYDILFFWVARMMMFGVEFMGDVPFREVYIHGLVRDEKGDKMSKTKGNVLDPLVLIDEFGTDALRFTIAFWSARTGSDIKLGKKTIETERNFANKIWNASRLILSLPDIDVGEGALGTALWDRWIVSRLQRVIEDVRTALDRYDFDVASKTLRSFFWNELCDWYLEKVKPVLYRPEHAKERPATVRTVLHVLETTLRLLHPIMPFLTEEIWQKLPGKRSAQSIMIAAYPKADAKRRDEDAEREVELLQNTITALRTIRMESAIGLDVKLPAVVQSGVYLKVLEREKQTIVELAKVGALTIEAPGAQPKGAAMAPIPGADVFVPLQGLVDFAAERARLAKEIGKVDGLIKSNEAKVGNENFVKRAPAEVVADIRSQLKDAKDKRAKLEANLARLKDVD